MKKTILATLLIACTSLPVSAAEGRWIEGYGQGNLEYFIDMKGMRLYIACPTKDGSADAMSSVSLQNINTSKDAKAFTITANGTTFNGPFDADSRAGESNFIALINALRKGDAVVKVGNQSFTFPLSNAAKIIPATNTKKFSCNTMFSS